MAATPAQVAQYKSHRDACLELGIPQMTLHHKKLKGTVSPVAGTANKRYRGPGPVADDTVSGDAATFQVWCVHQPFVRGEQRPDDAPFGIQATQMKEGQCAALDDDGNLLPITEDDILVDAFGTSWLITNPVASPDGGFHNFMMERVR